MWACPIPASPNRTGGQTEPLTGNRVARVGGAQRSSFCKARCDTASEILPSIVATVFAHASAISSTADLPPKSLGDGQDPIIGRGDKSC